MNNGNCVVCGKTISGMFYTTDRNQKFCGHHSDPDRCRHCLMVLSQGEGVPCGACLVKGFKTVLDAGPSIQRVLSWLETEIGQHSFANVPVVMDDGADFLTQQSGVTNWRYDGQILDIEIGMLQHSQVHIFEPTLAHEYGHVLLIADPGKLSFTGGIGQNRMQEEEGFCEVLRYLWVMQKSTGLRDLELRAISENTDRVYGDGFRLMWPRYKSAGSIMNLRNELLGLSPVAPHVQALKPGWPFGKKKFPPPIPSSQISPIPPTVQPTPIPLMAPGEVLEGGSHRPTLNLDFLQQQTPVIARTISPTATNSARPTIDMAPEGSRTSPSVPREPPPARPIIRFDE